jgi:hypothetical protein
MLKLKDWADLATVFSSIISLSAVVVAFFGVRAIYRQTLMQINDTHLESKKWKTLEICAQYELNDNISDSAKNIFIAFAKGEPDDEACNAVSRDAVVILNYLDGIAIGVGQGLYIEELARDHLRNIAEDHVSRLLKPPAKAKFKEIDENDYLFLIDMHSKWARSQTYYKSETEKLVKGA